MSFGAQIIFENVNLNIPDNVKIGGDYIGNYNEKTNCIDNVSFATEFWKRKDNLEALKYS